MLIEMVRGTVATPDYILAMNDVYDVPKSIGQAVLAMTIAGTSLPVAEVCTDPARKAKARKLVLNRDLTEDTDGWQSEGK